MNKPVSPPAATFSSGDLLRGLAAGRVGVWSWDFASGRVIWSPNMGKILPSTMNRLEGTYDVLLEDVNEEDRAGYVEALDEAKASGAEFRVEHRLRETSGEDSRWVEVRGVTLMKEGEPVGMTGTCQDVTDRRQTERELARRVRQQDGVARFGELAMRETTIQTLFDAAAVEVRRLLACEYCKVLELLPDGQNFLLRAGAGWQEGLVAVTLIPADLNSQAGYTLKVEHAVLVEDFRSEGRFAPAKLDTDHGVRSGISVLIAGDEGQIFGVLGALSSEPHHFRQSDIDFLQSLANALAGALHRHLAMQRQVLLTRELRHRVGNLLTLVLSLFNHTARRARSTDELFEKFVARVTALSRTHTLLSYGGWRTAGLSQVVREVLEPFIDRITIEGRDIQVSADSAFALGLALHELATNAAKFGSLAALNGRLLLTWRQEINENGASMLVFDWVETGVHGLFPPEVTGFGTRLVSSIVSQQLGGTLSVDYTPGGLALRMRLPLNRLLAETSSVKM